VKRMVLKLVVVAIGIAGAAWGQDEDGGSGRGVARVSLMNGDVSVSRGDSGDALAAAVNAPLMAEDRLVTGADSRAEVQFDSANMVRLAPLSEVRFAGLENQSYQLQVARGMVTFRWLRDSNAQIEISTPSVSVRPVRQGSYRIAVREDGSSEITVRSGEAEVATSRGSERVQAGRTMLVRGTETDPEYQMRASVANDEWDRWNENRDRQLEQSRSYNHVSRDIPGAEDLDSNGSWVDTPSYGYCWYPSVAEDWAPYRYGRWSWLDWYGWSWMSYDPWGWAPYHYGRWFYNAGYGWGWWPGYGYRHHYWSPGLVAFVGWNSWGGIGGGLGFGGIGWFPLAPYERYSPWYGNRYYAGYRNGGYYGNGTHLDRNVNIAGAYRNAGIRNAVTGVDSRGFVNGRAGSAVHTNNAELGRASLVRGALPVTPGRESLRFSDRAVRANSLSQSRNNTNFFSRGQTARADRVSFENQRRGVEQMARQTFGNQQSSAVNAGGVAGRGQGSGGVQRGAAPAATQGWSRFGESGSGAGFRSGQSGFQGGGTSRGSREGWSGFGGSSSSRSVERGQSYRGNSGSYSRSAPSYSGRSYSRSAPSYGGGSYSRSAPSYGGGGGHGSGGGRSSGGGGGSSGSGHHR